MFQIENASAKDTPNYQRPKKVRDRTLLKVVEKIPHHYTLEEQFRIHGRLEGEAAVDLLDMALKVEALNGYDKTAKEALRCYPGEDVLQSQINDLHLLLKNVRGENKGTLDRIIEELIELRRELYDNAEHGRDELRKVIKALEL